ncbi:T9SS type A sorting domain-containing protein [Aequorivita capsosiphonis]|uniref:T9SS type A sorting domain-containing protein n=1 Tax=Aequorivita capsosiphonis TaxID=487317 RepID=UPI0003FF44DC|nr:T9SS type A sorting domain-containing protein [Aequorivita capsosiphonis]
MIKKILLPVFLFYGVLINAQSVYEFQTENIAYQNLVESTSLNNGDVWDDPAYTISLGFDFILGGITYNTIYFPADGLGAELTTFPALEFGTTAVIVPIGQDMVDLGETTGVSLSPISYKIEGSAGNKILKIQWSNAGFYDDSFASDFMNFQVWFFEGSNVIEFHYGSSQIDNPFESYEEEAGPMVAFAPLFNNDDSVFIQNAYLLTGDPANPSVVILEGDDNAEGSLNGNIPTGTVYRFTPESLSTEDYSKADFQIYPNPTSDYLNIRTQSNDFTFRIYNALGQKTNTTKVENEIDVSNLSNGIYFIRIESETGSTTKKFIKQ